MESITSASVCKCSHIVSFSVKNTHLNSACLIQSVYHNSSQIHYYNLIFLCGLSFILLKYNTKCTMVVQCQHQSSVVQVVRSLIASLLRGRAPKGLFVKFNGRAINPDTQSQAGSQDGHFFTLFVLQMLTHLLQQYKPGLTRNIKKTFQHQKNDKHQRKL